MCRTEKHIDWDRVDELLEHSCLGTEIAAYFDMHPNTFYDRVLNKFNITFTEYSSKKKQKGNALIREAQFKKAVKKLDNTMLIWLGKQRLGQRETPTDIGLSEDTIKPLLAVMAQISQLQALNNADKSISNEPKSE
jgi:hypothetical protein